MFFIFLPECCAIIIFLLGGHAVLSSCQGHRFEPPCCLRDSNCLMLLLFRVSKACGHGGCKLDRHGMLQPGPRRISFWIYVAPLASAGARRRGYRWVTPLHRLGSPTDPLLLQRLHRKSRLLLRQQLSLEMAFTPQV
ncbi:hypothetical protein EJ06DRAFT_51474 [Trichodelitschia bisporula]|uniref:Secreted protein n=1 Tax=Trichodelitschia bisporula TaxID=703511 RepID=A0A6G1HUA8_9PEZI|nr:hypothetical protein EJ06DRAFT_51474 [Trichodelitschia bisporula]